MVSLWRIFKSCGIVEDIIKIISSFITEGDALTGNERLHGDLSMDSLDVMELIIYIENKTGVKVKNSKIKNIVTVNDLANLFL